MAESGLSIGLPELRAETGFFAGYGRTPANWSVAQLADIDRFIASGLRRVYYPPAVRTDIKGAEDIAGYEWTWLRPWTTLTITSAADDYNLPDDFSRFIGPLHYPEAANRRNIVVIPTPDLLEYRSGTSTTGSPRYASERWKSSTGSTGQRKEALFWPAPDASWTLSYQYEAYQGPLSDSFPYPLGGMKLAELYIESCLTTVEIRLHDEQNGVHMQEYVRLLIDAVARDKRNGAQNFGQMGHREGGFGDAFRRGVTGDVYPITYKGNTV